MPNTPVSINTPTTTSIPLNTALTIAGLSISDADAGAAGEIYTVSLMPSHGTLSLGSDAGITYYPEPIIGTVDMTNLGGDIFSAPPPGSLFIGGTLADINAALATLLFTPQAGYTGPGGFTMLVDDHATGSDARTSDYEAIALSIGINQPPAIAGLAGDTVAYIEESLPVLVDLGGNALVTDDNASFDGGSLTIAIVNRDFGEDLITFDEAVLSYGENDNGLNDVIVDGVVIGEMPLEYGTTVDDIAITFNGNATAARVTMLLNALYYSNIDLVDPTEGTRTVRFTLTDSGAADAQTTTIDSFITVTDTPEINREPVFDLDSGSAGRDVTRSTSEGAAAIALAPLATSDDPDLTAYNGGSLTIAVTGADAGDQLTLVGGGNVTLVAPNAIDVGGSGIVATWAGGANGAPLVITFLPVGSVATTPEHVVDDIVKAIRYRTTSDAPEATRTITFTLNDGGGTEFGGDDTAVATATVNVTAVNDAPVQSLPSTVATLEELAVGLNGGVAIDPTPVWIDDVDSATITTTLSAADGSFAAIASGGAVVTGAGTNLITVTGSVADVNKTVYYASDTPALDVSGSRTITVTTSDGDASDSDTITVTIGAVRDTPEGADVTRTAIEDTAYVLSAADFGFSDVDGHVLAAIQLSSVPLHGRIIDAGGYILAEDITGDGQPDVFLAAPERELGVGDVIELSLLAGGYIRYIPAADAYGSAADSFTYQVVDNGTTPFAPGTVDPTPNTLTFDITAVDDAAVAQDDAVMVSETAVLTGGAGALFGDNGFGADSDFDGPALAISAVNGSAGNVGTQITLASGALLTVNADGSYSYNANGAFDHLVSAATAGLLGAFNASATDSFSYTLANGDTATVTVTVHGADGAGDELWGNALGNTLLGTSGTDYFDLSQGGDDSASGLEGNDAFYFGGAFTDADSVNGGDGNNDQIGLEGDYTGANALVFQAGTIANVEVIGLLPGFDYDLAMHDGNVPAGGKLDVFAGNLGAGDNLTFNGSAETDGKFRVFGGNGTDLITTGAGDDGIYFGPGKFNPTVDRVDGGTGANDQLALDGDYALTLNGTAIQNIDVIALLAGEPGDLSNYNLTLADSLVDAGETMTIWGTPVETQTIVDGSAESDGNLKMFGGTKTDTLIGGAGDDWFWGGLGADPLIGGAGSDTFYYENVDQSRAGSIDMLVEFDDAVDKIDLGVAVTGFAGPLSGALDMATIGTQLEAAAGSLGVGQALAFTANAGTLNGSMFLLIDGNGTAGYQAAGDFLIMLDAPIGTVDNLGMFV